MQQYINQQFNFVIVFCLKQQNENYCHCFSFYFLFISFLIKKKSIQIFLFGLNSSNKFSWWFFPISPPRVSVSEWVNPELFSEGTSFIPVRPRARVTRICTLIFLYWLCRKFEWLYKYQNNSEAYKYKKINHKKRLDD